MEHISVIYHCSFVYYKLGGCSTSAGKWTAWRAISTCRDYTEFLEWPSMLFSAPLLLTSLGGKQTNRNTKSGVNHIIFHLSFPNFCLAHQQYVSTLHGSRFVCSDYILFHLLPFLLLADHHADCKWMSIAGFDMCKIFLTASSTTSALLAAWLSSESMWTTLQTYHLCFSILTLFICCLFSLQNAGS